MDKQIWIVNVTVLTTILLLFKDTRVTLMNVTLQRKHSTYCCFSSQCNNLVGRCCVISHVFMRTLLGSRQVFVSPYKICILNHDLPWGNAPYLLYPQQSVTKSCLHPDEFITSIYKSFEQLEIWSNKGCQRSSTTLMIIIIINVVHNMLSGRCRPFLMHESIPCSKVITSTS